MLMPSFESPAPCENMNVLELAFSSHQLAFGGQESTDSLSSRHSLGLLRRVLWDKRNSERESIAKAQYDDLAVGASFGVYVIGHLSSMYVFQGKVPI